ncbi:hypothetical protein V6N11_061441 [Hibiscus sabdariffa]|uniref:Homeobox domain-containing protein n=1 Tax=Hibiscus sabdariffa TaxID=183260 RepID=A0ABR2NVM8_9ROSI
MCLVHMVDWTRWFVSRILDVMMAVASSCKEGTKIAMDNGKYVRYTPEQVEALERLYHDCPKPSSMRRQQLIRECPILSNIEPKQIKVWFQNRRCYLGVELLEYEGSESILKTLWHHTDAVLCCSLKGFMCLQGGICLSSMGRPISYERAVAWKVVNDEENAHCVCFMFINWSFV